MKIIYIVLGERLCGILKNCCFVVEFEGMTESFPANGMNGCKEISLFSFDENSPFYPSNSVRIESVQEKVH